MTYKPPPISSSPIAPCLSPMSSPGSNVSNSPTNMSHDSTTVKPILNVLVIGTVDAGKSTATGHLVFKCGTLDPDTFRQFVQADPTRPKNLDPNAPLGPIHYSWLIQRIQAAKSGVDPNLHQSGVDIHPDLAKFSTSRYHVHVIDVPGHRDFVANLITGATRADVAVLVVSAVPDELARKKLLAGVGETVEHAMLAHTLGIKQLAVAVSKMDQVNWSQSNFNQVVSDISIMLKKVGYPIKSIPFVPISGATGHGLIEPATDVMPWFTGWRRESKSGEKTGMTLIGALDATDPPRRLAEKPLRISIQDVYKVNSVGTMPVGRVEAGILRPGMKLHFAPGNVTGTVISVEARRSTDTSTSSHNNAIGERCSSSSCTTEAYPGDNVGFGVSDISVRDVRRGHICSDASQSDSMAHECVSFTAQVIVMFSQTHDVGNGPTLTAGDENILDAHTAHVTVRVTEVISRIDRRTGQVVQSSSTKCNNNTLSPGEAAIIRCVPIRPLCIEPFAEYPSLGRFALRSANRHTVAVGIVKSVDKRMNNGSIVTFPQKRSLAAGTGPSVTSHSST